MAILKFLKEGKFEVINIKGTGKNNPVTTCSCSSWIEHWISNRVWPQGKHYKPIRCRCCNKKYNLEDLVGGHVRKINEKTQYIVPLCHKCNAASNDEPFFVKEEDLVPVVNECKNGK